MTFVFVIFAENDIFSFHYLKTSTLLIQSILYLPLPTLVFYCNGLVFFVLRLGAELAHALLFVPAEHLQQPLVLLTHPVLQVLHRRDQLVELQGGHCLVRLQVGFTVRGQTDQAGLQGLHLHGRRSADITHHLARLGCGQR